MRIYSELDPRKISEFSCVFFLTIIYFLFISKHRFIDGDEGYYLLASRLVMSGKTLYSDFFFTQAPLLPYVYGVFEEVFGMTWASARGLSALLSAVLGVMVYVHVRYKTGSFPFAAVALVLFVSSALVFSWFPIVKTYSLASALLFGCYMILSHPSLISKARTILISGFLFGLSVSTRSYLVLVFPILIFWIIWETRASIRKHIVYSFLCGFALGILPMLGFFIVCPQTFVFDNIGVHGLRSDSGFVGDFTQKLNVAWELFFGREDDGFQLIAVSIISAVAIIICGMRIGAPFLAFLIAVALGAISFLPTPTYTQYFCMCMPFFIVSAVCGMNYCVSLLGTMPTRQVTMIGATLIVPFVFSALPSFRAHLFRGQGIIGMKSADDSQNWTLAKVSEVSKAIDQYAAPNEMVASFWPGYLFGAVASPYPGYENDFGWVIAGKLTAELRQKYHISTLDDTYAAFAAHTPRVVILGNQHNSGIGPVSEYLTFLLANGYKVRRAIGDTYVLGCCSSTPPN